MLKFAGWCFLALAPLWTVPAWAANLKDLEIEKIRLGEPFEAAMKRQPLLKKSAKDPCQKDGWCTLFMSKNLGTPEEERRSVSKSLIIQPNYMRKIGRIFQIEFSYGCLTRKEASAILKSYVKKYGNPEVKKKTDIGFLNGWQDRLPNKEFINLEVYTKEQDCDVKNSKNTEMTIYFYDTRYDGK